MKKLKTIIALLLMLTACSKKEALKPQEPTVTKNTVHVKIYSKPLHDTMLMVAAFRFNSDSLVLQSHYDKAYYLDTTITITNAATWCQVSAMNMSEGGAYWYKEAVINIEVNGVLYSGTNILRDRMDL